MDKKTISSLMRFMAFGVVYQSPNNDFKNLRAHDLRFAQLRAQHALGRGLRAIQLSAGHENDRRTRYYLGNPADLQVPVELGQVPLITMWESMMPEAINQLRDQPL